jgi:hypothetical protein
LVTIDQAVEKAREFLTRRVGLANWFLYLEELKLEEGRWKLKFRYEPLLDKERFYLVEVDDVKGDIINFMKTQS